MFKTIIIASLNFRPAHVAHLVANYKLAEEIGLTPTLLVNDAFIPFLPKGLRFETDYRRLTKADYAIFWFPSIWNLKVMMWLKFRHKCCLMYVVHEPLERYSTYIKSGNSHQWTIKFFTKYYVSLGFIALSDLIIVPSEKALRLYKTSPARRINKNVTLIPLMFYHETLAHTPERQYFSYIGTISPDHAYDKFVNFISWSNEQPGEIAQLKFLIATRYNVERTPIIRTLEDTGRLKIIDAHPLTDEEINSAYASSFCVWNAYNRTTQSGVIAKSFMFGTPALVLKRNMSDFMVPQKNVVICNSNEDCNEIKDAILYAYNHFDTMSGNALHTYQTTFDYSNFLNKFNSIIQQYAKNNSHNRGGRQSNVPIYLVLEIKKHVPSRRSEAGRVVLQGLQCSQRA